MFVRHPAIRISVVVALAGCLFGAGALLLPHSPSALRAAVLDYGWAAPLAFTALWALATPALFSGTMLALASGLLFGPVWGTAVGVTGATLGGLASFTIARRLGSEAFAQLKGRKLRRIRGVEKRIAEHPFRSILLLRLMPGMPVTWFNYAVGLTRVRAVPFALASALGACPRVFIYAALGGSFSQTDPALRALSVALIAGLGITGAAVAMRERRRMAAAVS